MNPNTKQVMLLAKMTEDQRNSIRSFELKAARYVAEGIEQIEERGGNSFMEYSVPEAILKLRQGVGRLIRSCEDEGRVVLLDARILSKRYGKAFLAAMPEAPVLIED